MDVVMRMDIRNENVNKERCFFLANKGAETAKRKKTKQKRR